jgi:hypothetical protein
MIRRAIGGSFSGYTLRAPFSPKGESHITPDPSPGGFGVCVKHFSHLTKKKKDMKFYISENEESVSKYE